MHFLLCSVSSTSNRRHIPSISSHGHALWICYTHLQYAGYLSKTNPYQSYEIRIGTHSENLPGRIRILRSMAPLYCYHHCCSSRNLNGHLILSSQNLLTLRYSHIATSTFPNLPLLFHFHHVQFRHPHKNTCILPIFSILFLTSSLRTWARRSMDRTSVSGTDDVGSIPTGPTIFIFQKPLRNQGFSIFEHT